MKIDGAPYRTIWLDRDGWSVSIIDQTKLPHDFVVRRLTSLKDAARAIRAMQVRGAPLIGVAAAYGLALGLREDASDEGLAKAAETLLATRPTAVNLRWAIDRLRAILDGLAPSERADLCYQLAASMAEEDVEINRAIGDHGLALIERAAGAKRRRGPVNILTHCNAGWLATVDWGTALAPVYRAQQAGIDLHVWVDETRPRNQGAFLTAWELAAAGVPHTVITDNAGGHLMQRGQVDLCLVGTDRTTATGDVANKIGTYLKALAAEDNGVPFYVCLPSPTIDWELTDGFQIPIEERSATEVTHIQGQTEEGETVSVRLTAEASPAANPAFDVTPARLVTGLVTERGVCKASRDGLLGLFPERQAES
jgi:methylthioribose-1-phosphate isomerase